jgi:zinc/manganese transport system substrate-binding protein
MDRRAFLTGVATSAAATPRTAAPLSVVASFSILADIVRNVGGARIKVASLVGPGSDPHMFEPAAGAVRVAASAALIVVNGLGFEGWIDRLFAAAGRGDAPVVASGGVEVLRAGGAPDPHAWQTAANGQVYARNIAAALGRVDPTGRAVYAANAERYTARLADVDRGLRGAFATVPPDRRTVLTSHDAFAYFGRTYGIRLLTLEGMTTRDELSARRVGRLIRTIRADRVSALFLEAAADPRVLREVSRETGVRIGGELFADMLSGPGGPAADYLSLLAYNGAAIRSALSTT